jgi:hypothetical protein
MDFDNYDYDENDYTENEYYEEDDEYKENNITLLNSEFSEYYKMAGITANSKNKMQKIKVYVAAFVSTRRMTK